MRDYLVKNIYAYRAYGFVAIEKYENAIDDIRKARKMNSFDAASYYNKYLGKGILRMDNEDFIMATKYFGKASIKFPENKDTYCLMVIAKVKSASF
jgi:tetratricopeptide (TPR) repeat protein